MFQSLLKLSSFSALDAMQIAPYDQLQTMERLVDVPEPAPIGVC